MTADGKFSGQSELTLLTPQQAAERLGVPGSNPGRVIREHANPDGMALFVSVRVAGYTMIDPRSVDRYVSFRTAAARLGLLAVARETGFDWERSLRRLGRGPQAPLSIVKLGRTFVVTRESLDRFIETGGGRQ